MLKRCISSPGVIFDVFLIKHSCIKGGLVLLSVLGMDICFAGNASNVDS